MGRRHEQTFLQRGHTNGQQTHEKMLNITRHHGNTNQNHNGDTTSHQSKWLKLTSQEKTEVSKDTEKGEPSHTVGGNASRCNHAEKQCVGSSKS